MNNSSGRQENNDRISALPDSIIGVILSNLPTKNAVATSSLSKRWIFMWRTVHNLDFRHEVCWGRQDKDEITRFVRFVDGVLLHHDAGLLNKFCLDWRPMCIASNATSWINTAITRNVHELCVCVDILVEPYEPFEMPMSVFSCASLRSLELSVGISISAAIVVCLPRLESLKLVEVFFQSQESFKKLISACPMLNYLHLHIPGYISSNDFGQDGDFTYIISSTSLRRLSIEYRVHKNDEGYSYNVDLEASSLEYLKLVGFIPDIFVRKCLSTLVEADVTTHLNEFDISEAYICNSIIEAVRVFDCVKALTLSANFMWAFSFATISLSTELKRLVKLETEIYCCACSSLTEFIQSSNNLEVLTIYQRPKYLKAKHDHSKWAAPIEVPRCLSNSLRKVVLKGYHGYEDEREMIRYMLKHGSSLELMEISCHGGRKGVELELFQEICQLPRKSPACEVKFVGLDVKEKGQGAAVTTDVLPSSTEVS